MDVARDLIYSTVSNSLWISEQTFYLIVSLLEIGFYFACQLFNISLSWVPVVMGMAYYALEQGLYWLTFLLQHLLIGGMATLNVCIQLILSSWEQFAELSLVVLTVAWEGVCALFSLVYIGGSTSLSMTYQCVEVMVRFTYNSLQTVTWKDNLEAVSLKMSDSLKFNSFSEVVSFGKAIIANIFYISVGLLVVVITYYVLRLVIRTIIGMAKKRNTIRDQQPDIGDTRNTTDTTPIRSTLRQRRTRPRIEETDTPEQREITTDFRSVQTADNVDAAEKLRDELLLRQQLSELNSELSEEKDKNLCVVCLDKRRELLLKPCNHYCLCSTCVRSLRVCPVCSCRISSSEKIFHV